ncbi:MAG TPA: metallophosphoesterase [Usitatibacter sp.]|nr:metallophosphoesterase [Usitatibacter sp.]
MPTFLLVAFSIYGAMHAYALRKAWAFLPHFTGIALGVGLAGVLLTASPLLVWLLERRGAPGSAAIALAAYAWMGYLFLFVCTGLALDAGRAAAHLLRVTWPLGAGSHLAAIGFLAAVLTGYGFLEARGLEVEEVRLATPKLATGRVTLAQISDLHLGAARADGVLERVARKLRELRPDIVVATGDIVDGRGADGRALARLFESWRPPLGAYAVTGNHEYHTGLEASLATLREAGFVVLRGESVHAGPIVLTGVDDRGAIAPRAKVPRAGAGEGPGAADFVVLLKHQPVVNGEPPFDLQLSGHVHGGQVFPFGVLTRLAYGVGTGLTALPGGRWLYVSRGAGTWGPPIRLFAPPEITAIVVSASGHAAAGRAAAQGR